MATGDRRDAQTWVVLELAKTGETALEDGELREDLYHRLNVIRVHIPAVSYAREGRRITIHLMEGYIFIGSGLPETRYFRLEGDSNLVRQVLSMPGSGGIRALATVPDVQVESMRSQLRAQIATDISEGMLVKVVEGVYSPLQGRVVTVTEEEADVLIELRSIRIIKSLPRVFLEPVEQVDGE